MMHWRPIYSRIFIAIDEWLGIFVLLYLHKYDPSLFFPFLIGWAIMVYVVSYPWHWLLELRHAYKNEEASNH